MASEVFRKALELSGSGFDQILGAVQKQAERIDRNTQLAKQLEQKKDFSRFQADLGIETARRQEELNQELTDEYFDENLEREEERARAIGDIQVDQSVEQARRIGELEPEPDNSSAVRERMQGLRENAQSLNEDILNEFSSLLKTGIISRLPEASLVPVEEDGKVVGNRVAILVPMGNGEFGEVDNLVQLQSAYKNEFRIAQTLDDINTKLSSNNLSEFDQKGEEDFKNEAGDESTRTVVTSFGKKTLREYKTILSSDNIPIQEKIQLAQEIELRGYNYHKDEEDEIKEEFKIEGLKAFGNLSSTLPEIEKESEVGFAEKMARPGFSGTAGGYASKLLYSMFSEEIRQTDINVDDISVGELSNILRDIEGQNINKISEEYLNNNISLPSKLTNEKVKQATYINNKLSELKNSWIGYTGKTVNWDNYTLNPNAFTTDIPFDDMFIPIEKPKDSNQTDLEEAKLNGLGTFIMGEAVVYDIKKKVDKKSKPIKRSSTPVEKVEDTIIEEEYIPLNVEEKLNSIKINRPDIPVEKVEDEIIQEDLVPLEIEEEVNNAVLNNEKSIEANKVEFGKTQLEDIRDKTEKALSNIYPDNKVQVKLTSHKRDLKEQAKHYLSGASKTPVSLHNFGLAGDFAIFIDGKQVTGNGRKGLHGSVKPYQVLGHFAKDKGFFWGWKWDSGHVGQTRFVTQALKQNSELADSTELKNLYNKMIERDELPKSLSGLVNELGSIYNKKYSGKFTGEPGTIEDLLEPINPKEY